MDLFSANGAKEALTDYTCRVFHQNEGCPRVAAVAEADELSQLYYSILSSVKVHFIHQSIIHTPLDHFRKFENTESRS